MNGLYGGAAVIAAMRGKEVIEAWYLSEGQGEFRLRMDDGTIVCFGVVGDDLAHVHGCVLGKEK